MKLRTFDVAFFTPDGKMRLSVSQEALTPWGAICNTTMPPDLREEGPGDRMDVEGGYWTATVIE